MSSSGFFRLECTKRVHKEYTLFEIATREEKGKRLVYSKKGELLKTNETSMVAPISNSTGSIANQTVNIKSV